MLFFACWTRLLFFACCTRSPCRRRVQRARRQTWRRMTQHPYPRLTMHRLQGPAHQAEVDGLERLGEKSRNENRKNRHPGVLQHRRPTETVAAVLAEKSKSRTTTRPKRSTTRSQKKKARKSRSGRCSSVQCSNRTQTRGKTQL